MRVPKREDQSLFISPLIVRQLSSQSIILDQVQLSYEYYTRSVGFVNPFYKFFFQNGGGGNRTLVFVGSDMRLSPNRLPNTPPKKSINKIVKNPDHIVDVDTIIINKIKFLWAIVPGQTPCTHEKCKDVCCLITGSRQKKRKHNINLSHKKKTVRAGQTLPRNYHRTLSILDEDLTPHQDLLFTLYMYKDYRA